MIGDPSGRSTERNLLEEATVDENCLKIAGSIQRLLGDDNVTVVNNKVFSQIFKPTLKINIFCQQDWAGGMDMISFLRDVGRHFRVGTMLSRDSVKNRMGGEGITFTEFSVRQIAPPLIWLFLCWSKKSSSCYFLPFRTYPLFYSDFFCNQ